jgi:hypothetical protein
MEQDAYTYMHITAATRRVIERQKVRWQNLFEQAPDLAEPRTFSDTAMGAYLVWAELNGERCLDNDRTALLDMVDQISAPPSS